VKREDVIDVLNDPLVQELMRSPIPARLAVEELIAQRA
jgi:hypothetical protein